MKLIFTFCVLLACFVILKFSIGVSLIFLSLVLFAGSFKQTKSGKTDGRSKIKFILLLLGLVMLIVGVFLEMPNINN